MIRSEAQQRMPLILLIGVIVLLTSWDWIHGLESWMAVPGEITAAFLEIKGGDFSWDAISELSSLLGCTFLHADMAHLVGNLIFFWIFGAVVLELCGWRWMLVIFVTTSVGATLGQMMLDPYTMTPGLGASGAVMGFEGAYLGMVVRKPRPDPYVWPMSHPMPPAHLAGLGVVFVMMDLGDIIGQSANNIAYGAHVGGFVAGIFVPFLRKE